MNSITRALDMMSDKPDTHGVCVKLGDLRAFSTRLDDLDNDRAVLALAIMAGEDAPGFAAAQSTETLVNLLRDRVKDAGAWGKFDGRGQALKEAACMVRNIGRLVSLEEIAQRIEALRAETGTAEHPDDQAVDRFAVAMKVKLADARAKGRNGWDDPEACSTEYLSSLLLGHVGKGNPGNFEDIANLCMMLHQRGADPSLLATQRPVT